MQRFVDDDRGYLDWLGHHPDGFVINTGRTPSSAYLMLHRASCGTITGAPARGTTFTGDYAKVCGERDELEEFARHLDGDAQPCGLCLVQRGQLMSIKAGSGKYGPLREYLSGAAGTRVRMSFKAVEDLVGRLPESAYRHRAWWGNNDGNVEAKVSARLAARAEAIGLDPGKLTRLVTELNDNYGRGNAYAAHALLRAILDHVPPLLGCADFRAAANSYPWSRTDRGYARRLLDFKLQADDALHRQIWKKTDHLGIDDMPPKIWVNRILQECAEAR